MTDARVVEMRNPPMPAPPMTVPVLLCAILAGCLVGVLVLAVDAIQPGRVSAVARVIDPAAAILVGTGRLPFAILGLSVAMNAAFYGLLSMIALVAMTLAGARAHFERQHWVTLGTLVIAMMVAFRIVAFHQ